VLDRSLQKEPNNADALLLRATILEFIGARDKAMQDAEAVLQLNANTAFTAAPTPITNKELAGLQARARALQAWIYAVQMKDLAKAEELAQQAQRAEPSAPDIADTLAWILYLKANGEQNPAAKRDLLERAAGYASRAVYAPPIPARAAYHFAAISYARGPERYDLAERYVKMALDDNPCFLEAEQAQALLEKVAPTPPAPVQ